MTTSKIVQNWEKSKPKSYVKDPEKLKNLWRFDMGEHQFKLSPKLNEILKDIKTKDLKERPDISCKAVKSAAAKFWGVKQENITIDNGSDQLIWLLPKIFMNPGDISLVINPTFFLFADAVLRAGGRVTSVQTNIKNGFRFTKGTIDSLIKVANQKQAKIIWLCNPNNPTGETLSLAQVERIIKNTTNRLVVVDEVFFEVSVLSQKESAVNLIEKSKNLIVLKSLSKSHGLAGIRVGFGIANKEIIDVLESWRLPFSVSIIHQRVAPVLLRDQQHFQNINRKLKKEKIWLFKSIKRINDLQLGGESKTIFFLLRHKSKDLFEELIKHKILAADFRQANGIENRGFVRITVKTQKENKILLSVLKNI